MKKVSISAALIPLAVIGSLLFPLRGTAKAGDSCEDLKKAGDLSKIPMTCLFPHWADKKPEAAVSSEPAPAPRQGAQTGASPCPGFPGMPNMCRPK